MNNNNNNNNNEDNNNNNNNNTSTHQQKPRPRPPWHFQSGLKLQLLMQIWNRVNLQLLAGKTCESTKAISPCGIANREHLNIDALVSQGIQTGNECLGIFQGIKVAKLSHDSHKTP